LPHPRLTRDTSSPAETARLGRALGEAILEASSAPLRGPGAFAVALSGELGSGKTTLVKGLASGLGVREAGNVTSPTFVIRKEYRGRVAVRHYDAYRLGGPEELLALGFEEDLGGPGVVVVEWADRVRAALPPEALWVELEHLPAAGRVPGTIEDAGRRRLRLSGEPAAWEGPLTRLAAKLAAPSTGSDSG